MREATKNDRYEVTPAGLPADPVAADAMVRVTIGGPDLHDFAPMGYDQWFRLFLPRARQLGLCLPTAAEDNRWYAQYLEMSSDTRPFIRNYTIRAFRPAGAGRFGAHAEIDIDSGVRGDTGPASTWADRALPGTRLGLLDEGTMYQAPPHTNWSLPAGDESALPAIAGVLRSAPRDLRGAAYIEVPHSEDIQELGEPTGVRVHWLPRNTSTCGIGTLATEAVRGAQLPHENAYAFVAGEQRLASGIRRHLVRDRGFDKSAVTFTGYWRAGRAASS